MTRDVLLAVEVEADPKVVFDTIADAGSLATFWTPDVRSEGSDGRELSFGFPAAPTRLPATVIEAQAPTSVAWAFGGDWPAWSGTTASWSLEPSELGTKVVFRHGFRDSMPEFDFGSVTLTWALVVARLKDVVESGGTANPALR
ncbi:MAG TPA: SRPBCC family protein [Actinomycetota bacterium]|nr:SRPBCC family protein [Actinomycetota bacterium]